MTSGGLNAIDAGSLKGAREVEAVGFPQPTLAANEKVSWNGGYRRHPPEHHPHPYRLIDNPRGKRNMTVNAVRLNHAVLFVTDLEQSISFYSEAFGMTVAAREGGANAAFLRLARSGNHHDLGLFEVGAQPSRARSGLGLYHLAWQVDTVEELEQARLTLANLDAYTGESSHGATKSVYGKDPDGNEFEVMWMLPRAHWGEYENAAPVEPLDLPSEVRRWSGVRTAGELVPVDAT